MSLRIWSILHFQLLNPRFLFAFSYLRLEFLFWNSLKVNINTQRLPIFIRCFKSLIIILNKMRHILILLHKYKFSFISITTFINHKLLISYTIKWPYFNCWQKTITFILIITILHIFYLCICCCFCLFFMLFGTKYNKLEVSKNQC